MLKEVAIPRTCHQCRGSGVWTEAASTAGGPYIHDPCPTCKGTGYQEFYKMVLPDLYFWATDILNCIVPAEYTALDAEKRGFVGLVLSVGICNLNVGSTERSILINAFAAGSETRANLVELVSEG